MEHQIASRIATTINTTDNEITDNPLVKRALDKESKWLDNLIIHYIHEQRLETYKKCYSSIMESNIRKNTNHFHKTCYRKSK
jgi:hypothetical protein